MEALQNNTKTSRLLWLDMANVLAMVGVVLFHIPSNVELSFREDEFVAVNECFFLMSGVSLGLILQKVNNFVELFTFLNKRIVRLGVPTVVFLCCFTFFG